MDKYMLICSYNEGIDTKTFATFEEARAQMLNEVRENLWLDEDDDEWLELASHSAYEDKEYFEFGFDSEHAYTRIKHMKCDWEIVKL